MFLLKRCRKGRYNAGVLDFPRSPAKLLPASYVAKTALPSGGSSSSSSSGRGVVQVADPAGDLSLKSESEVTQAAAAPQSEGGIREVISSDNKSRGHTHTITNECKNDVVAHRGEADASVEVQRDVSNTKDQQQQRRKVGGWAYVFQRANLSLYNDWVEYQTQIPVIPVLM